MMNQQKPLIVYEVEKGKHPINVRFERAGYCAKANEIVIEGGVLPQFGRYDTWDGSRVCFDKEIWLDMEIRPKRNRLLAESDKMMLVDNYMKLPEEKRTAWTEYRQTLRELPQCIDPNDPIWPIMPH